jgi:hypothetical protein
MNHNCKCGGRICSLDWQWNEVKQCSFPSPLSESEPNVAHFQCDKCGRKYNQRKRQKN